MTHEATPKSQKSSSYERLFDVTLLSELRRIELQTKRKVNSDLVGKFRSAFRGSGLVFSDLREYQPGDEIKSIHWPATVRTNKVHVKSYSEERQLTILLVLDLSHSTAVGYDHSKRKRALEFAALMAFLARKNGDKCGLCLFSDRIEQYLPPRHDRKQFYRIISTLLECHPQGQRTDLASALAYVREQQRKSSIVFIVSDFFADSFERELQTLSVRHDCICVSMEDPSDHHFPAIGIIELVDSESGVRRVIDSSSSAFQRHYSKMANDRTQQMKELCLASGCDYLSIQDNPIRSLSLLMAQRSARIRR